MIPMNSAPIIPYSDLEWLLLTTPDDTEEAPWMTMPDFQWRVIVLLMSILRRYRNEHGLHWYLGAELKVTMPRQIIPRDLDLGPDMLMAEAADRPRRSWNVEEEGGPPLFVLEVVTEESWRRDTVEKPFLYDRMGVIEYAIFAPERKGPGPRLFGHHRNVEGDWVTWEVDEAGALRSDAFGGLLFFVDGGQLRVRDAEGRILLSDEEVAQEAAAHARREAAHARQETARADAAEAELRRLKAAYGIPED
jgi:hypothetical protein